MTSNLFQYVRAHKQFQLALFKMKWQRVKFMYKEGFEIEKIFLGRKNESFDKNLESCKTVESSTFNFGILNSKKMSEKESCSFSRK